MANHKSAIKRIRSSEVRRSANRLQHKTARNAIRNLRNNINKKDAKKQLPKVISLLDKLVKKNIIHLNKASNLKVKVRKTCCFTLKKRFKNSLKLKTPHYLLF